MEEQRARFVATRGMPLAGEEGGAQLICQAGDRRDSLSGWSREDLRLSSRRGCVVGS